MPELGITRSEYRADNSRWWNAETDRAAAAALTAAAAHIETNGWRTRYLNYVCAQAMTGRGMPSAFGFSMSQTSSRNAASTAGAIYNPPVLNCIATAADVFRNKVYNQRPFLQFIPRARNDFRSRADAIDLTAFLDAQMDFSKLWELVEECADDCMTFPTAWLKVGPGLDGVTEVTRVLDEEILFPLGDDGGYGMPRSMIQRSFLHKEDVAASSLVGDDDIKRRTILNAQGVFSGFYSVDGAAYKDIIALCEGWRLPLPDGTPGRHVIAIGETCLLDEPWERPRYPFARLRFSRLSNSYRGQSLAEQGLPLQKEIDRIGSTLAECERRQAWPRWLAEKSSKVNPRDLQGPGFVLYSVTPPSPIAADPASPQLYASLETKVNRLFQRFGISANQVAGNLAEGLSSGRAIIAAVHVDDSRHVSTLQELEDFVTDVGNLIIEQNSAGQAPELEASGQKLKWNKIAGAVAKMRVRSFPMSRLPTLPAAREQTIQDWFNDGTIDRVTKTKLQRLPDTGGQTNIITAADDYVSKTLDDMIVTGEYTPPSPFSNLAKALEIAQARWLQEATYELAEDRLNLIARYVAALLEMMPAQQNPGTGQQAPAAPAPQEQQAAA